MAEQIKPFIRVNDHDMQAPPSGTSRRLPRLVQVMRVHFGLAGGVLFLAMVALVGLLYGEFDNVTITRQLGLRFVRDIYEPDIQKKMLLLVSLGIGSLLFVHASTRITRGRHGALLWSRAAALVLLVGIPVGIMVWRAADRITELDSMVAEALADFPWVLYILAGILIGQSLLALWYQVSLSTRSVRSVLAAQARVVPVISQLVRMAVMAAGVALLAAGGVLGVLTTWLYEVRVADARPGDVLYATSFDGYADDWDVFEGRDEAGILPVEGLNVLMENADFPPVNGSALVITQGTPTAGGIVWSALDRVYRDFDLRVTMQQVSGPYDQNQYGVIFRYRDEENFYIFRITSDGWYKLAQVSGGVEDIISDWGETSAIHTSQAGGADGLETVANRANVIRITAQGDRFRFWVNGEALPLCLRGTNSMSMWASPGQCLTADVIDVYTDSEHEQGQVALAVGTLDGTSVTVAFDDLVITGPESGHLDD